MRIAENLEGNIWSSQILATDIATEICEDNAGD